jgi:hypothetical protein
MSRSPTDPNDRNERDAGSSPGPFKGAAPGGYGLIGIGFEFAVSVIAFGAMGWGLDRRWNTSPWLLLVGLALGFSGGLYLLIKSGRQAFKD